MTEPAIHCESPFSLRNLAWLFVTLLGVIGVAWLATGVRNAREAARNIQCQSHLNQMHLALHNYHDTFGCFPPAFVADADGKPMHSWRVLLLPFIDQLPLYKGYRLDEPWNSPHNLQIAERLNAEMFRCPNRPRGSDPRLTNYVVIVGAGTAFPGTGVSRLEDFADGLENTILMAEIANSDILWTEPRDLVVDHMSFAINDPKRASISGAHPSGPAVVFGESIRAYRLDKSLRPETLRALITIAGGEPVKRDSLIRPDYHPRTLEE